MPDTLAQAHQKAQEALANLALRHLAPAHEILDVQNLAGSLPRYIAAVHALVQKYGPVSATIARRYCIAQRSAAGVSGAHLPDLAKPAPLGAIEAGIRFATRGLWTRDLDSTAIDAAQTQVAGLTQRAIISAGRDTIITNGVDQDKEAHGWARVPEGNACDFCAMLATRGGVYTEDSADFESHDHCNCQPEATFSDDYTPPADVQEYGRIYDDSAGRVNGEKAKQSAFREALAQHRSG